MRAPTLALTALTIVVPVSAQAEPTEVAPGLIYRLARPPESRPGAAVPVVVLCGFEPDHTAAGDPLAERITTAARRAGFATARLESVPVTDRSAAGAELTRHIRLRLRVERHRLHWIVAPAARRLARDLLAENPREVLGLIQLQAAVDRESPEGRSAKTASVGTATPPDSAGEPRSWLDHQAPVDGDPTDWISTLTNWRSHGLPRGAKERTALDALDDFHDAATRADAERYFGRFTQDGVFLGTDASERWSPPAFRRWAAFAFERESAWMFTPWSQHLTLDSSGRIAWFDEQLDSRSYGTCRGSGVLRLVEGRWRVAQYNLSIPIPNALAKDFVERIRNHDDEQRK